jgi:hypothetical protein
MGAVHRQVDDDPGPQARPFARFTPVQGPQSIGIAVAFVNPPKRDNVHLASIPDARTVFGLIAWWIDSCSDNRADSGLMMRSSHEFLTDQTAIACVSGETAARSPPAWSNVLVSLAFIQNSVHIRFCFVLNPILFRFYSDFGRIAKRRADLWIEPLPLGPSAIQLSVLMQTRKPMAVDVLSPRRVRFRKRWGIISGGSLFVMWTHDKHARSLRLPNHSLRRRRMR